MASIEMILLFSVACGVAQGLSALYPVVPPRVPALEGTCVLIPCSFTKPMSPTAVEVRLLYHRSTPIGSLFPSRSVFSTGDSRVHKDYRGRVTLTGDTSQGDCSVTLSEVREKDTGSYELEIRKHGDKGSERKKFYLDVSRFQELPWVSGPGSVRDGQLVEVNCSVGFPCPSQPPALRWHWARGDPGNGSETKAPQVLMRPGQVPLLWTSISFTASHQTRPHLSCEASFPDVGSVRTPKEFQVKFAPRDVHIRLHSQTVKEGGSPYLECSCKADPPVESYQWFYTTSGQRHMHKHSLKFIRMDNVTRDTYVVCSVQNSLGRAESPPTSFNVEYTPLILHSSSLCEWDGAKIDCRCVVDSNPRAAITWSVDGSPPTHNYNTTVAVQGNGTTTGTLWGFAEAPPAVICYAVNAYGNDSQPLMKQVIAGFPDWMMVAALCSGLSLLLLISVVAWCRRRRTEPGLGHAMNHHATAVYPGDVGIYQDHRPLYINCTEVTHIYTNGSYQLVYQNCTPCFVRSKQVHKRQRLAGWRDQAQRDREIQRRGPCPIATSDAETGIYLEVI
ncbi:myelin-associated glycoprotein isoform X2 [Denticeps clupeoides]|uniref:Ig-like domain-containing protein n=1 Tax=Denticeps clupeoides TaxID=299321 RepID=A0AAY4AEH3_9TELE|nr:myelin-associated glycoprotein-like isoform X2 [Denticeps clupeoides]